MFKNKCFRISLILSLVFLSCGFALLHYGLVEYGIAFFVLLPVVVGFSIGALPSKGWSVFGLCVTLVCMVTGMIMLGLEGAVCGFMVLGILLPLLFLGSVIGHLVMQLGEGKGTTDLKILVAPFLLFLFAAPIENVLTESPEVVEAKTEIILPYTPDEVFDAIKSVDTLDVPRSFLMQIGLPVPHKCILEKEEVGAQRTCYFDGGQIKEEVTAYEKGKVLQMIVTDYQLTGRKWLGFKDAIYLFEELPGNKTKLTRITTYTSELKPRLYWQPLEEMGIQQEHDYVFRNLQKDLANTYSR
ncbi:polyketide cyclase [Pontibacter harenae]|uniref:polyketide cyclase n=1 Tax=Pontibacter harenae TaxID=2894083 RepID=UPI001E3E7B1E|nr:polyketide cyclase [Pontibacter harenae]MCC9166491.1 polyketide cyclase [Pontibacter harenae]